MAEHWCKEHQQVWFKKGKMKGYAHPVLDENGEQVYDEEGKAIWCNEPVEEKPKSKKETESPERQMSIEWQNAYGNAALVVQTKYMFPDDQLINAAYNYGLSKLTNWGSLGNPPKETKGEAPEIPQITRKQLKELADKNGYKDSDVTAIIQRIFKVENATKLDAGQRFELSNILKQGKYKPEPEELEPDEVPF